MPTLKFAVLAGDYIGPEVMTEALRVLEHVAKQEGLTLDYQSADVGGAGIDRHGKALPDSTLELCAQSDAILFGSVAAVAQPTPRENAEEELRKHDREYELSRERPKAEENEEDVKGRQEWFNFQRRFPFDAIPAGARAAAIRQTQAMELKLREALAKSHGSRTLAANSWEGIGPNNVAGRIPAGAANAAQRHGWRTKTVCKTHWVHHHKVRRCHKVRTPW